MNSALVVALLLGAPGIASNSHCPSARAIESYLSVFLPAESEPPGTVVVTDLQESLLVDLRPEAPAAGALRSVAVGSDCDERAKAAAVVIATWWPTGRGAVPSEAQALPAPPERHPRLLLSAGAFASAISDGVAPGVRAEVSLPWRAIGFRLALAGTGDHGGRLGRGQVAWRRASAELGVTYGRGHLRLDGGLVASLFAVQGSGFAENQSSLGAAAGATAGLRISWTWRTALPWLELRGIGWPQSQQIYVQDSTTGVQTTRPMPHGELQMGAGVAFSLF